MPREMAQIIRKDAESRGLSVNALTLRILTRYTEWDRFTQKIGFVSMQREMLRAIIDGTGQETLDMIAKGLAGSFKESILLWFKEINEKTFFDFFRIASYYSGLVEYDLKSDGKNFTITLHHQLGEKWSKAYQHFAVEMFKTCLGVDPIVEIGKSHAVIRFAI